MRLRQRTLIQIAEMICGNSRDEETSYFPYRSSSYISEFFAEAETDYRHDGSTRHLWVADRLKDSLSEAHSPSSVVPDTFLRILDRLMEKSEATNDERDRPHALRQLNDALDRDRLEAFYAEDGHCYLRNTETNMVSGPSLNPHRPLSTKEMERRDELTAYLDACSEDQLIEEVLLPMLRQRGFQRITFADHRDKALEYGKDVWMKYVLPTQHVLYFGIQAKKDTIDAAGTTKSSRRNVAEVYNQALMMADHEIFDPEFGKRVLIDHAFIVSGGQITKQARNWLGGKLDASKRRQLIFMDRNDILNLYVTTNLPVPSLRDRDALRATSFDEPPF